MKILINRDGTGPGMIVGTYQTRGTWKEAEKLFFGKAGTKRSPRCTYYIFDSKTGESRKYRYQPTVVHKEWVQV